ncbi:unsaturated glucuronyl hydrolase [Fusarium mundagurra]|uniref:Unsaturated glucuronyl hydrolase n=1 Tax=Fusarium mundagurra TaxID=1567541 RepID=A0A8H5XY85_9HYPO|nr:unsaturated glucuronyl hydrolase [Fusarium mundagurra]
MTATTYPKTTIGRDLSELFAENVIAKLYRTAIGPAIQANDSGARSLDFIPDAYPEEVPQDGTGAGCYVSREPDFWTSGFFPGSLYCLLERLVRYPKSVALSPRFSVSGDSVNIAQIRSDVQSLCRSWAKPLHAMASRQDTHDLGFMIMPALQRDWELTGNAESLDSILEAADSLSSRFVPSAGAIRSWDERIQRNIQITCQKKNCILIIDSMCNMDLLYYAASHSRNSERLREIATAHATTLLRTHLRPEPPVVASEDAYHGQWYSTYHVANVDPKTGLIKQHFTAQGYSDTSTWARGQAWAILGYAQTYMWTKDKKFLQASCGLTEYFLYRLETSPGCVEMKKAGEGMVVNSTGQHRRGRYVPLWDFDAPIEDTANPTRDSSAGAIAAGGMLVLSQGLASLGYDRLATRFRTASLDIMRDLANFALAPEKAQIMRGTNGQVEVRDVSPGHTFAGLLKYGTANNNENAIRQYANHGLVYGDYYFMEYGNRLLSMGFE